MAYTNRILKRDVVKSGPIFEEIFLEVVDDGSEVKGAFHIVMISILVIQYRRS